MEYYPDPRTVIEDDVDRQKYERDMAERQKRAEEERLIMVAANLARKLGIEGESALRDANVKFDRRFRYVEARATEDAVPLAEAGLERLDGYWNEIRTKERG